MTELDVLPHMTRDDAIKLLHLYAKIGADLDQSVAFRMDHDPDYEAKERLSQPMVSVLEN